MVLFSLLRGVDAHFKNSKNATVAPRGLGQITTETNKPPVLSFIQTKGATGGFCQKLSVLLPDAFRHDSGLLSPCFPGIRHLGPGYGGPGTDQWLAL